MFNMRFLEMLHVKRFLDRFFFGKTRGILWKFVGWKLKVKSVDVFHVSSLVSLHCFPCATEITAHAASKPLTPLLAERNSIDILTGWLLPQKKVQVLFQVNSNRKGWKQPKNVIQLCTGTEEGTTPAAGLVLSLFRTHHGKFVRTLIFGWTHVPQVFDSRLGWVPLNILTKINRRQFNCIWITKHSLEVLLVVAAWWLHFYVLSLIGDLLAWHKWVKIFQNLKNTEVPVFLKTPKLLVNRTWCFRIQAFLTSFHEVCPHIAWKPQPHKSSWKVKWHPLLPVPI